MAVQFESSLRRSIIVVSLVSLAVDYMIVLAIISAIGVRENAVGWAMVWTLAFEIVVALYALLNVGKRLAWFFLFEREKRVAAVADDIRRHQLPGPEPYYNDADDYLFRAAMAPETPNKGRLFAGMILGAMAVQRLVGPRVEAMLTAMTIEQALQRIPVQEPLDEMSPAIEDEVEDEQEFEASEDDAAELAEAQEQTEEAEEAEEATAGFNFGFDVDPPERR